MSVLCTDKKTKKDYLFIKGAPEYLLEKSNKILSKTGKIVNFDG